MACNALKFMLNDLSPELHGLLCEFVRRYITNIDQETNFENHGKSFFEEVCNLPKKLCPPSETITRRASETLKDDPAALYKLVECDPDILNLRDQLKYLVLGYLLNNPEDLEQYGADYFSGNLGNRKKEHPRRFGGGNSGSLEITAASAVIHYDKTSLQFEHLRNKIKRALLFRSLDDNQMNQVLAAMFRLNVTKGSYVIRQGDDGDYFYVVDEGVFEAYVKDGRGIDQKVSTYKGNGSFGELALLYNMPRVATVKAITDGALWCLDRDSFRKIVVRTTLEKKTMYKDFIAEIPILSKLNDDERQTLADALQPLTFEDGECIIKLGESAEGMYFVEEGAVVCSDTSKNGKVSELSTKTKGEYFGQMKLSEKQPQVASAYAAGRVRLAFVSKQTLESILQNNEER